MTKKTALFAIDHANFKILISDEILLFAFLNMAPYCLARHSYLYLDMHYPLLYIFILIHLILAMDCPKFKGGRSHLTKKNHVMVSQYFSVQKYKFLTLSFGTSKYFLHIRPKYHMQILRTEHKNFRPCKPTYYWNLSKHKWVLIIKNNIRS